MRPSSSASGFVGAAADVCPSGRGPEAPLRNVFSTPEEEHVEALLRYQPIPVHLYPGTRKDTPGAISGNELDFHGRAEALSGRLFFVCMCGTR